jgi:hypothetical protein
MIITSPGTIRCKKYDKGNPKAKEHTASIDNLVSLWCLKQKND